MRGKKIGLFAAMIAVSLISTAPAPVLAAGQQKVEPTASPVVQGTAAGAGQVTGNDAQQNPAAETESDLQQRLNASARVITTMMARKDDRIPPTVIQKSQGIAIFPDVTKVALGLGGRYGGGVMLLHRNNEWSGPIFLSLYGASIGAQLGAEQSDLIMVFTDQKALDDFSDGELQLGAEASIAAGPWGAKAGASTQADVLAYKETEGVFAGIALSGAVLHSGEENNRLYYAKTQQPYTGSANVFTGKETLPKTEAATPLIDALNKYVQQQ